MRTLGSDLVDSDSMGLTKREYFAAMAMQGLLAIDGLTIYVDKGTPVTDVVADHAVKYADALIKQLNAGDK